MSNTSITPAPELPQQTYTINGHTIIGESPTFATNLRGRTYMKDIPSLEALGGGSARGLGWDWAVAVDNGPGGSEETNFGEGSPVVRSVNVNDPSQDINKGVYVPFYTNMTSDMYFANADGSTFTNVTLGIHDKVSLGSGTRAFIGFVNDTSPSGSGGVGGVALRGRGIAGVDEGVWKWVSYVDGVGTSSSSFSASIGKLVSRNDSIVGALSLNIATGTAPLFVNSDGSTATSLIVPTELFGNSASPDYKQAVVRLSATGMWESIAFINGSNGEAIGQLDVDDFNNVYIGAYSTSPLPITFFNSDGSIQQTMSTGSYLGGTGAATRTIVAKLGYDTIYEQSWEWATTVTNTLPRQTVSDGSGNSLHALVCSSGAVFYNVGGSTSTALLPSFNPGNIVSSNMTFAKLNPSGIWSWVAGCNSNGYLGSFYGDISLDRESGSSYVAFNDSSSGTSYMYNANRQQIYGGSGSSIQEGGSAKLISYWPVTADELNVVRDQISGNHLALNKSDATNASILYVPGKISPFAFKRNPFPQGSVNTLPAICSTGAEQIPLRAVGTKFSFSLWIKTTLPVVNGWPFWTLMRIGQTQTNNTSNSFRDRWLFTTSLGYVGFSTNGSSVITPSPVANLHNGEWHHIVFTSDDSNGTIYVDGVLLAGPSSYTAEFLKTPVVIEMGSYNLGGNQYPYNGSFDDVAIFDGVLTQKSVNILYNGGVGNPASSIHDYDIHNYVDSGVAFPDNSRMNADAIASSWNFAEGTGDVTRDTAGINTLSLIQENGVVSWITPGKVGAYALNKAANISSVYSPISGDAVDIPSLASAELSFSVWYRTTTVPSIYSATLVHVGSTEDANKLIGGERWLYLLDNNTIGLSTYSIYNDGDVRVALTGTHVVQSPVIPTLYDGNWHHIVGVFAGAGVTGSTLYFDGVLQAGPKLLTPYNNGPLYYSASTKVGSFWTNHGISNAYPSVKLHQYVGDLDNITLFSSALTQADVTALYNGGDGVDASYYNFEPLEQTSSNRASPNDSKVVVAKLTSGGSWEWRAIADGYGEDDAVSVAFAKKQVGTNEMGNYDPVTTVYVAFRSSSTGTNGMSGTTGDSINFFSGNGIDHLNYARQFPGAPVGNNNLKRIVGGAIDGSEGEWKWNFSIGNSLDTTPKVSAYSQLDSEGNWRDSVYIGSSVVQGSINSETLYISTGATGSALNVKIPSQAVVPNLNRAVMFKIDEDIPDTSNQDVNPLLYQPEILLAYGPYRENWTVPSGASGAILKLVDGGNGALVPDWINQPDCNLTQNTPDPNGVFPLVPVMLSQVVDTDILTYTWAVSVDGVATEIIPSVKNVKIDNANYLAFQSNTPGNLRYYNANGVTATNLTQPSYEGGFAVILGKISSTGEWQWVASIDGFDNEVTAKVTSSQEGGDDVYLAVQSSTTGAMLFYNADGTNTAMNLPDRIITADVPSTRYNRVIVAAISSSGTGGMWQWAASIDSVLDDIQVNTCVDFAKDIFVACNGNTGSSSGTYFYNSDGLESSQSLDSTYNVLFGKLSQTGYWKMSGGVKNANAGVRPSVASTETTSDVYMAFNISTTGYFRNNDGSDTALLANDPGKSRVILTKMSSDGMLKWSSVIAPETTTVPDSVTEPSIGSDIFGNCYVSCLSNSSGYAYFYNSDGSLATTNLVSNPSQADQVLIAKINPSGFWQWAASINSLLADNLPNLSVDSAGYGYFICRTLATSGAINVYNSDGSTFIHSFPDTSSSSRIIAGKIDPAGNWITMGEIDGTQIPRNISVEREGTHSVIGFSSSSPAHQFFDSSGTSSGLGLPTTVQGGSRVVMTRTKNFELGYVDNQALSNIVASSGIHLSFKKMHYDDGHPFSQTELFEVYPADENDALPLVSIVPGVLTTAVFRLDENLPLTRFVRRWEVDSIQIYDENISLSKYESVQGRITTEIGNSVDGTSTELEIQWTANNAGRTLIYMIMRRTTEYLPLNP